MEQVIIFSIFIIFLYLIVKNHKKFIKNHSENVLIIHKYIDSIDVRFFGEEQHIAHVDIDMKE